jgi:hypothetical protein
MNEDARKAALKKGLRQLTCAELHRVIDYPGQMMLDDKNYADGKFCPLAVGLGLDRIMKSPSETSVVAILGLLGYEYLNTRDVKGQFYTHDRRRDLLLAAHEVLEERK